VDGIWSEIRVFDIDEWHRTLQRGSRAAFLARQQPELARLMRTNRSVPQKICKRVIGLRFDEVVGFEPDRAHAVTSPRAVR
jgi:hypothetical protein